MASTSDFIAMTALSFLRGVFRCDFELRGVGLCFVHTDTGYPRIVSETELQDAWLEGRIHHTSVAPKPHDRGVEG